MGGPLSIGITGGVGTVVMASPPANALGTSLIDGLNMACETFDDASVGCVVFSSSVDRFFAAGADLKLLSSLDQPGFQEYLVSLRSALERIADAHWLSIAAIDGHALGCGLELAMACTYRVVSPRAQLGLPEVKLGLLPGAGGTQRLTRLVGRTRSLDMLVSGRSVDASYAATIGLADRIDEEPALEAERWARELADGPRATLTAIRRCVDAADGDLADGMAVEAAEVIALFCTADGQEGIRAFVDKRAPRFGQSESP